MLSIAIPSSALINERDEKIKAYKIGTIARAAAIFKVDEIIKVMFKSEEYVSTIDLVVFCNNKAFMGVKCVAGSLASYEREIIAGSRLLYDYQIPFSVSTNGIDALITDTVTGESIGIGMDSIPSKKEAEKIALSISYLPFPETKREREMIIFRSYNTDKINVPCSK